jgi:DNA-binding transcriptional regulator YhcF (GntR family)
VASIRIDPSDPAPVYQQIVNALRTLLVARAFSPGDRLPTVRELALDLGVHHNTVAEAYRMLADEGWLELRRRQGATVLDRARPRATTDTRKTFGRRLRALAAEAHAAGLSAAAVADALRDIAEELTAGTPSGTGRRQ